MRARKFGRTRPIAQAKVIQKDDGHQVWKDNKLIGFVDENDVLSGIHPETGYSVEICPIGHTGEIIKQLERWLKSLNIKT